MFSRENNKRRTKWRKCANLMERWIPGVRTIQRRGAGES
jgi:hypothetical protein